MMGVCRLALFVDVNFGHKVVKKTLPDLPKHTHTNTQDMRCQKAEFSYEIDRIRVFLSRINLAFYMCIVKKHGLEA